MKVKLLSPVTSIFSTSILTMAIVLATSSWAFSQREAVLHRFAGTGDGVNPFAGVVRDAKGNLYGVTIIGGAYGFGAVYQVTPAGVESVLYSFMGGSDGGYPDSNLVLDSAGNLYGTTQFNNVFKLTPSGTLSVLHAFMGPDGSAPYGTLIRDAHDNLYGTTQSGGAYNAGTVFEIASTGKETVLYSFTGGADGGYPFNGGLLLAGTTLYGTTAGGGTGYGVVYKVTLKATESVVYTFLGGTDGDSPEGNLVRDKNGNLFGNTFRGGASDSGTVFQITPAGTETILHSFGRDGTGGYGPYGGLVADASGNLYGATTYGGNSCGCGTVYKLTPSGKETLLYAFKGGADGDDPAGALILDAKGNLYGATYYGGVVGSVGNGVVFKVFP
ncbi:MAG: choice-of-anchor tandem repeat GloVer-containing protein [Candidatus Sulfotelmatobacter sp.]